MDINEKIAQRRREREQEIESARVQLAAQKVVQTEIVKREARRQLIEVGGINSIDEDSVKKEKEKIIEDLAHT